MTSPTPHSLTYLPVYVGLFASLALAAINNAFLDIQYGSFGMEALLWTVLFGITLAMGWRQSKRPSDAGKRAQRWTLALGVFLTLIVFIPMWGFPRAGLAILAMLQAAQNCVTVTRRQLHFGLLVSAIMVMFAATHYRADWTMLFYLVPYVSAVVFTLVAEQINRRALDLRHQSLAPAMASGQGSAIATATAAILLIGTLLYMLTPQPNWSDLSWRYGQPSTKGIPSSLGAEAGAGNQELDLLGGSGATSPSDNQGDGQSSNTGHGWPSPAEMRQTAQRPGMPAWQRQVINGIANTSERVIHTMTPIMQTLEQMWQSLKNWINKHRATIARALILLAMLALLIALWRLMREAKSGTWLRTRFDYLRFGIFAQYQDGSKGTHQLYRAMERLFMLYDSERSRQTNTHEYQTQLRRLHGHVQHETAEITRLFEDVRYGDKAVDRHAKAHMQGLYRRLYQKLQSLD